MAIIKIPAPIPKKPIPATSRVKKWIYEFIQQMTEEIEKGRHG
jgi:hypothetical protein